MNNLLNSNNYNNHHCTIHLLYKILLNPDMEPLVKPQLVPGFGTGGQNRNFGMSYSIYYKIPLLKK